MERLTERNEFGIPQPKAIGNEICGKWAYENCDSACDIACPLGDCFSKLADYEDAEEKGLLIRLPYPVGTTLYKLMLTPNPQYAEETEKVKNFSGYAWEIIEEKMDNAGDILLFGTKRIGEDWFFTREEAEAKLKKMEDEDEQI